MLSIIGDLEVELVEGQPLSLVAGNDIVLVVEGDVLEGGIAKRPGTVIYRPQALTFGADGGRLLRISIHGSDLTPFGVTGRCCATMADYATPIQRIRREMQSDDPAARLALRSATLQLLARAIRLFRARSARQPMLDAARSVIAARFREPLRIDQVAVAVGIHPRLLSRAFRSELGMSVAGAIRLARVEAAARELCVSAEHIPAVATRCGFYDSSHLIRAFEAVQGITPAKFREMAQS